MDMKIPDPENEMDIDTYDKGHHEEQENQDKPKEIGKPNKETTNNDQALEMVLKVITDANYKVDSLSQEMKKMQAQNIVLTRELHQVYQWIGACVKTQGKRNRPSNPKMEQPRAHQELTKKPERLKKKPFSKGIEDSIHAPNNQVMEILDVNDNTNKTQNTNNKQTEKPRPKVGTKSAPSPLPVKPTATKPTTGGTSPTLAQWSQIHLKTPNEWGREFTEAVIRAEDRKK
jgi:hypothetical protein